MPALDIFRKLHHISLVVADLERSIAAYTAMGIGPWSAFPPLTAFRHDLRVPDTEAFLQLRYAYAALAEPSDP
ncbi:MAG TPA: hypothetical protein VMS38_32475 [Pseudorhodoferax sp.]|nr:hypothetical protein [Pseudorhodoferax sp.]